MKDILEEIISWKRIEVDRAKERLSPRELYSSVESIMAEGFQERSMSGQLKNDPCGIIAEFKRKSPSKGWIKECGKAEEIPASYACNGAAAISILTDEKYFGGCLDYISTARPLVDVPIMRKEFIIDEYQLFEARKAGADAVLLIAANLRKDEAKSLASIAHELKLEVLLELHSEHELEYAELDVDMVGINNRNLGTFHTDVQNSFFMSDKLPQDKVHVSESGISNTNTIKLLRDMGYQGFLIGENFMRTDNPGLALKEFINELK